MAGPDQFGGGEMPVPRTYATNCAWCLLFTREAQGRAGSARVAPPAPAVVAKSSRVTASGGALFRTKTHAGLQSVDQPSGARLLFPRVGQEPLLTRRFR